MRRSAATLFAAIIAVVPAVTSLAHEFWIQPSSFSPARGSSIGVQLRVGDGFPGESRPRDPNKLVRLFVKGPQGEHDIPGQPGDEPAGQLACKEPGVYVVGYRSKQTLLTLEAEKFEEYLKEEGLDIIIEARAKVGESQLAGREHYSRASKCLVRVAGEAAKSSPTFEQMLGFPAEITPQGTDPTMATVGQELAFVVTHNNLPAPNVVVMFFSKNDPSHRAPTRTDDKGVVRFTPDQPGMWMLGNVMMQRAAKDSGSEWDSVWASLTFEVAPAPTSKPTTQADENSK
ncbi:MAG TPA: DUF4198 domain-containing protein [Phycisphaerales bacterium]|nr:DUF4198 domain-containing protein [Phycisphaerales bacterium]